MLPRASLMLSSRWQHLARTNLRIFSPSVHERHQIHVNPKVDNIYSVQNNAFFSTANVRLLPPKGGEVTKKDVERATSKKKKKEVTEKPQNTSAEATAEPTPKTKVKSKPKAKSAAKLPQPDESEEGQIVVEQMPSGVTDLLQAKKSEPGFPHAHRMSLLTRRIYSAGVDVDAVERYLIRMHSPKREEFVHYSKHALRYWRAGDRAKALEKMSELYVGLEDSGKSGMPIKRVEYFLLVFRMVVIMEEAAGGNLVDELKAIEDLCDKAVDDFNSHTLPFYYWLTLVKSGSDQNKQRAQRLCQRFPKILDLLEQEMSAFAADYSKMNEKPIAAVYKTMPAVFVLGDIETFSDSMLTSLGGSDVVTANKIVAYKALSLWNAGHFSKGLTNIAVATEAWVRSVDDADVRLRLGVTVTKCLSQIVKESVEGKLSPAMNFLDIMCEKLTATYSLPLIWYVYFIHLSASEVVDLKDKAARILGKFPVIEQIRNEKFERCLTVKGMTQETMDFFIGDFLANLKVSEVRERFDEAKPKKTETVPDKVEPISEEILSEMLDIKILESLERKDVQTAIEIACEDCSKGVLMSEQVLKELVFAVIKSGNQQLLNLLKQALPLKSPLADLVFQIETDFKLKQNHVLWKKGGCKEAVTNVLSFYKTLQEEEYHVQSEVYESLLSKMRNYLRLYLEESFSLGNENDVLPIIKQEGLEISNLRQDFSVLVMYWEALFFSSRFQTQQMSEDFLQEQPKVARHVDVDRLLGRASRQRDETRFRRLLEICLQFDLDDYEKTRAFEGLLVHQCERGQFQAATTTLNSANGLGVSIGADAMTIYNDLQLDLKHPKKEGIFSTITGIFSRKKDE